MVKRISNIPQLRFENALAIARTVWEKKSITRKEICRHTSLAPTTISNITNTLIDDGIFTVAGKDSSTGGRQPDLINFNPKAYYVIGAGFGPFTCRGMIADMFGQCYMETSVDVKDPKNPEEAINNITTIIESLAQGCGDEVWKKILGIGISFPGTVDSSTGTIRTSSLLGDHAGQNFREIFGKRFGYPVFVENDANLCALNEAMFGAGKGKPIVLFLYASFGIGCGMTQYNEMYLGASDASGNIGHTVVELNGKKCYCGSYGCLETIASLPALYEEFQKMIKMGDAEEFNNLIDRELCWSTIQDFFTLAQHGNPLAVKIIEKIGSYIGVAVANLLGILNPDIVVLGGHYLPVKDIIVGPIRSAVQKRAWPPVKNTEIVFTEFGMDSEIHGAVSFVIQKFLKHGLSVF